MKLNFNKKWFFIILIVLALLSLLVIYLMTKNKTIKKSTTGIPVLPTITSQYKGPLGTPIFPEKDTFSLPKEMPLYKISTQPLNDQFIYETASRLGFGGDPKTTKDITLGTATYWQTEKASIFFYPSARRIEYSSYASYESATNKQLTDEATIEIAKKFLLDNKIMNSEEIGQASIIYLKKSKQHEGFDEGTKNEALLYKIIFNTKTLGYEIVTKNPDNQTIIVNVLKDGTIWSAQVMKFNFSSVPLESYKIKNFINIKNNILKEGVLISLTGAQISSYDLPSNSIKNITISDIKPAYLLESYKTEVLYPIFLIKGLAEVTGFSNKLTATLYMYAISQ